MTLVDLKNDIQSKHLAKYYIFTGEEWLIMQVYLNELAKVFGGTIKRCNLSDFRGKVGTTRMTPGKSVFVFTDEDMLLHGEINLNSLATPGDGDSLSIFIFHSIDKRTKFYKDQSTKIIEFGQLSDAVLTKYLKAKCKLSEGNIQSLIEVCEHNYGRCLLEIEKIKRMGMDENAAYQKLIQEGTIYIPPKDAVFDLVDAVLRLNTVATYRLLEDCQAIGEANLVIISNLYNSAKAVYQVQTYNGNGKITDATGLTPFLAHLAAERKNKMSAEKLVYLMNLCIEAQKNIKIGLIDDQMSVQWILANFFSFRR